MDLDIAACKKESLGQHAHQTQHNAIWKKRLAPQF